MTYFPNSSLLGCCWRKIQLLIVVVVSNQVTTLLRPMRRASKHNLVLIRNSGRALTTLIILKRELLKSTLLQLRDLEYIAPGRGGRLGPLFVSFAHTRVLEYLLARDY